MRVKTAERRDAILAAAAEVFLEEGFEGASMAGISARIGGSKGTLYSYFKSKEELFVAVTHEQAKKQMEPALAALEKDTGDLQKTLQVFGEKAVSFLCQESTLQTHRMIVAESGRSDIGRRFHESGPKLGMERIAAFLSRQMQAGRLKQADPMLATLQLCALLDCETVKPMMLGLESAISRPRMKRMVGRAVETFLAAYAVD
ncbi:TetR/AcrR family transcriptional regulator [Herbaspirillum seropedicae]|uniref:Transcription regulator protein n=1 Tax=Herbaspirillum seropedicae (strain SmR1) TaxID=757424 RepID=D8IP52_HERSS|nr:TetR/AcrR family transcriptional regulator [Herbaspirillum seropedicae]ADJ62872.1 transcription regulator protein [Herbaspirillum seropedicae SmR1]AKN64962.1 transcriptional regulator [Herbaspirillum seropedicae]NQE31236.1 transcriptional regulator [Herbaspirillum seropedicae]UMU20907.1 TetR/AcrR family transcriptional regulator [Herbaspirillum seropedicae]